MMRFRPSALSGVVLAVCFMFSPSMSARGADDADAQAGARIARDVCAQCHQVDPHPTQYRPTGGNPPPFAWIARERPEYLDGVLLRPPHGMWGVSISPTQSKLLKAYCEALRDHDPMTSNRD